MRRFTVKPGARFVVVGSALFGEDAYEQEVHQLARSIGIEDAVEFTGFRDDVASIITSLDLIVHASTIGEPFGQVIIEGMAAGKPVVATNGGDVREIVEDHKTGILVPMGDVAAMAEAICELLSNPDRAQAMGALGRERIERYFTIQRTARNVEGVCQQVLQPRQRRKNVPFGKLEGKSVSTD